MGDERDENEEGGWEDEACPVRAWGDGMRWLSWWELEAACRIYWVRGLKQREENGAGCSIYKAVRP